MNSSTRERADDFQHDVLAGLFNAQFWKAAYALRIIAVIHVPTAIFSRRKYTFTFGALSDCASQVHLHLWRTKRLCFASTPSPLETNSEFRVA